MIVEVCQGKSNTLMAGAYVFSANADNVGGTFSEDAGRAVTYYFLRVGGRELAGVWIDRATAEGDAEALRNALSGAQ